MIRIDQPLSVYSDRIYGIVMHMHSLLGGMNRILLRLSADGWKKEFTYAYCHNNVNTTWHLAFVVFMLCFVAFAFATTCWWIKIYIFRVSRRRREVYCGHARLCACLSLAAFPHYCTDPDVTWGNGRVPTSCALLGGFAIGARVSLLVAMTT